MRVLKKVANPRHTSIKAFHQIESEGLLPRTRFRVYKMLVESGPMTGGELNYALDGYGYHKRLSELERQGIVRRTFTRACRVTGRECEVWEVVDQLPTELDKTSPRTPSQKDLRVALTLIDERIGPKPVELERVCEWLASKVKHS